METQQDYQDKNGNHFVATFSTEDDEKAYTPPDGAVAIPPRPSNVHVWDRGAWVFVTAPPLTPADHPLSARQLRLGLIANGFSLASVGTILDAIADPVIRDQAQVWWEFTDEFHWDHDWTQILIAMMGISKEQAAAMWMSAKDIVA